jgi:hypothetical protein
MSELVAEVETRLAELRVEARQLAA